MPLPRFRFEGWPPGKQNIHSPDDPAPVNGVGPWVRGEVHEVTEETADWCRGLNTAKFTFFTELDPEDAPAPAVAAPPAPTTSPGPEAAKE